MFNLTYFQTRFPILTDPGLQSVQNNLGLLGVEVSHVGETLLAPTPVAEVGTVSVAGVSPSLGTFFQPGWLAASSPSFSPFSQTGLLATSYPWSSTSNPGKTKSVWEKLVPRAPLPVSTAARPLSASVAASSCTPAASINFPVPALASGISTSSPVDGLTSSSSVVELVADLVEDVPTPAAEVQEATLVDATDQDEEMLEPFPRYGPLGQKGESLSLSQLRARL